MIQDAGGDCVALVGADGTNPARVAAQWRYDAYGKVLGHDRFFDSPELRAGHKGLFADRLDEPAWVWDGPDQTTGAWVGSWDTLTSGAMILYNARNRTYSPDLGRFLQQDPNATAQTVLASASAGSAIDAWVDSFDALTLYGDGPNLFGYLGGNPWTRWDSLGLSFGVNPWPLAPTMRTPLPPLVRPQYPSPIPRPSQKGWRHDAVGGMGRTVGVTMAAIALNGGRGPGGAWGSLASDRAWRGIVRDTWGEVGAEIAGARIGGSLGEATGWSIGDGKRRLAVQGRWLGSGVGAMAGKFAYALRDWAIAGTPLSVSGEQIAGVLLEGLSTGLDLPSSASLPSSVVSGITFGAGLYSGVVEYLADSIHDW